MEWLAHAVAHVRVLEQLNQMTASPGIECGSQVGNRIVAGSTLKIPGSAAVDVDTSTHEQTTYQVRPGDTLYDISRAESVSLDQLMKWNQLSPGSTIRPGDELVIWRRRSG